MWVSEIWTRIAGSGSKFANRCGLLSPHALNFTGHIFFGARSGLRQGLKVPNICWRRVKYTNTLNHPNIHLGKYFRSSTKVKQMRVWKSNSGARRSLRLINNDLNRPIAYPFHWNSLSLKINSMNIHRNCCPIPRNHRLCPFIETAFASQFIA